MDYYHYKAEDFASEDYFKNWVNAPDPESDRFWSEFNRMFPEKYYDFHEGRRLVEGLSEVYESSVSTQESSERIWERLEKEICEPRFYRIIRHLYPGLAAACLCIGLGLTAYFYQNQEKESRRQFVSSTDVAADFENKGTSIQLAMLPDGSEVHIDGGSTLGYRETNGVREVTLHGGAFFKVVRKEAKTFEVKAGGVRTTVLGTSFRVRAYDKDQNVTVEVKTGKVRVTNERDEPSAGKTIVLVPNQKVTFSRQSQSFRVGLVNTSAVFPAEADATNPIYIFDDAPVEKVFEAMESQYGVAIIYDKELMKECRLKINLERESFDRKLEIISLALGIAYEKKEGTIVFEKKGCL